MYVRIPTSRIEKRTMKKKTASQIEPQVTFTWKRNLKQEWLLAF